MGRKKHWLGVALALCVVALSLWAGLGTANAQPKAAKLDKITVLTIAFFLLFQKGGPLSSVPAILAGGAAIMAIAGIVFFREAPSWQRIVGVAGGLCCSPGRVSCWR